jgi:hypothetical protein
MGTQQVGLRDVIEHGGSPSRLRLLAPLRYLSIRHREKRRYDLLIPISVGACAWAIYMVMSPKPPLWGDPGLLRFARDLLIMAVPFMIGALAAVSMGAPGEHLDRRPLGVEIMLANDVLTLRQFLCYLLGYLSFLGMLTLIAVVGAELLHHAALVWTEDSPNVRFFVHAAGTLTLSMMLSFLSVTVLWGLYFLTDVVNQKG